MINKNEPYSFSDIRKDKNVSSNPSGTPANILTAPADQTRTSGEPSQVICEKSPLFDENSGFISSPQITHYQRVTAKHTHQQVSLYTFLQHIKNGGELAPKDTTDQVRSYSDPSEYKAAKARLLQAVTPSGTFNGGHELKNLVQYNDVFNIDIDVKDNPELFNDSNRLRLFLERLKHQYQCIAYWRSVSHGVSILYRTRGEIEQHLNIFLNIEKEFKAAGIKIDENCKNVNRLRFSSYDPDLYINPLFSQNRYSEIECYEPKEDLVKEKRAAVAAFTSGAGSVAVENASEVINSVLRIADHIGLSFTKGNRTAYTLFVASRLNWFGVSMADALAALEQVHQISAYTDHADRLRDVYTRYRSEHGTKVFFSRKKASESVSGFLKDYVPSKREVQYNASIERYLTEYQLPETGNFILNVPTNSGKTFFFAKGVKCKRILLVPSVALARQIESKYGIIAVYEGVSVHRHTDVIVATYEALPRLVQVLNVPEYDLYIDESHAFVQSSDLAFRNKPLSYVAEFMEYFNRTVLLTGTWLKTETPAFKDFELVNIQSKGKEVGLFTYVVSKHKTEALKQHISRNKATRHAIYFNNKSKAQELAKALERANLGRYLLLTSVTKNLPAQAEFIRSGELKPAYAGVIFTDVIREGLGIENVGVSFDVHILTKADSTTTEQVINRVRNVVPRAYYYATETAKVSNIYRTEADRLAYERTLFSEALEQVERLEQVRSVILANRLEGAYQLVRRDERATNQFTDKYRNQLVNVSTEADRANSVNALGVANSAYKWYSDAERANPKMLLDTLATFGYKIRIVTPNTDVSTISEDLKAAGLEIKEAHQQQIREVLADFAEKGSESYISEVLESKESTHTEKDLAFKYLYLHKRLANVSDVLEILTTVGTNTKSWNKTRSVLDNQISVNTQIQHKRSTNAVLRGFASAFEIGKAYTSDQIYTAVKAVLARHKKTATSAANLTKVKAVQLFKEWYTTEASNNNERVFKAVCLGAFRYDLKPEYTYPKQDTFPTDNITSKPEESVLKSKGETADNQVVSPKQKPKKEQTKTVCLLTGL